MYFGIALTVGNEINKIKWKYQTHPWCKKSRGKKEKRPVQFSIIAIWGS